MDPLLYPPSSTGTTLLTNVLSRRRTSLDGTWRVIIDPYDSGYIDIVGQRNSRGYFRDFTPRSPSDRVEYDFDTSLELEVPGDWNTQHPELHFYEGTVWYRRLIEVDDVESGRTFVHFGAANHTTRVFLDGHELATHVGGFGSFAVEVTGRLGVGTHSLVVQVNNTRTAERVPAMRTDWWNFGGITRSVELVHVPDTFVRDAWLTMAPDGRLVGGASVDGDSSPVTVDLPDAGLSASVVDGRVEVSAEAAATLERWRPGTPVHHTVRWTCGDDEIVQQVGFRTVETRGNRIFVNGEQTYLRGISIHGEGPSGGRRAHGPDDAETLLDWAEDLGCNFVRLAHYQHDEHMVRAADRRGLLMWTELPVYWGIAFGDEAVRANAVAQADELVVRDRSYAGIILWSVANETLPGPERDAFLTALANRARDLDPTRLTTAALLTLPSADPSTMIDDPLGEVVDVLAVNQYYGWYYGSVGGLADVDYATEFGKPIVFIELGAGAKFGRHGEPTEVWTEEHQAAVYDAQIAMIRRQEDCVGMSPWILKDFRTPMRVLVGVQDGYNRKGLVSEEGERKLAFDVLRRYYDEIADLG
jgi:beta-glucuronidase